MQEVWGGWLRRKGERPLTDPCVLGEGIPGLWLGFELWEAPSFEDFVRALILVC